MDQLTTDAPLTIMTWRGHTQPHFERSSRWYLIGGVLVIALAAYGILNGSWPFTVVMILLGAMYYILRGHVPPDSSITISNRGVQLDQAFMRWEDAEGFWIVETPDYTELHISSKLPRKPEMKIQTGNQSTQTIRTTMQQFVQELPDKEERILDMLIRILKI